VTRTHPEPSDVAVDELKRKARRRLIGAIVLALAAAVALPLLFESEPRPLGEDVSVQIPPMDGGKFVTPLSSQLQGKSAADKSGTPSDKAGSPASPTIAGNAGPTAVPAPKAAAETRPAPITAASSAAAINAGAVTSALPADRTTAAAGAANTDAANADAPKSDTEKSEPGTAASPPPFVTAPAPDRSAPSKAEPRSETQGNAKASPKPAGGFVVQVAALADPKAAAKLVGRLKSAGFAGYSETFPSNGRTMQRVRVGPYPSRDAAESARNKLKAAGFSGIVDNGK